MGGKLLSLRKKKGIESEQGTERASPPRDDLIASHSPQCTVFAGAEGRQPSDHSAIWPARVLFFFADADADAGGAERPPPPKTLE